MALTGMRTAGWCLAVLLGVGMGQSAAAQAQNAASAENGETKARIERVEHGIAPIGGGKGGAPVELDLPKLMKAYKDPAFSVAVVHNFKIVWAKAYGTTELGVSTPVTTKTLFQAGSISKPVAATAMLALVQQGKLSLDEDVNVKLKTWKVPENEFTKEQKVTLRRLASHCAGLTVHGFPGYDVDEKVPTVVQIFNGEKPANTAPIRVDFVPGTKFRYSGGGITIEQTLLSDVTGKAFPALVKELVLDKMGMSDSSYEQPLPAEWQKRTPTGTYRDGKAVHGKWHVYPEMAAAGLWTTPTDLAKFAIEIALSKQGKSNKVLTQATVKEMLTPQIENVGLGFFLDKDRPGDFGHNGSDEGFQALLVMNAETGDGYAAMANSDFGVAVATEYLRSVAKEYAWKNQPEKRDEGSELTLVARVSGPEAAIARYEEMASAAPNHQHDEAMLNMLGYVLLTDGKTDAAIAAFAKNVKQFPESSNVYDSLGEAYAAAGKKELAIENYEKSLKLDPKNQNAKDWLKKLRGES
ncbi:MAG TPA: serine hydrolase [Candidatus Acidoferrum sp.]|nr:serine hydrolase [Candidatus Acidoferrum sp.]